MKYILYKTTNLINGYIYIGIHGTEDPEKFDGYIGNGIYISQPSTYKYGKTVFQQAVKKYGPKNFRRETIITVDTVEQVLLLESIFVDENFLKRPDVYNMVLGGTFEESTKTKCYQYDIEGNYIREFESMADACRHINKSLGAIYAGILNCTSCAGFYWSKVKVNKLDVSDYIKVTPKKVYRYLAEGGDFDKEFDSISSAAIESNTINVNVSRSAKLGYKVGDYYFSFVKDNKYADANTKYIKLRPVYQYDSNGNFIKSYDSQQAAENENKYSNITKSIKTKKPCCNGYLWGLEQLDMFCSTKSEKRKIGQYDTKGNLINTFNSIKDCCNELGVPRSYITHNKTWHGYVFKYI